MKPVPLSLGNYALGFLQSELDKYTSRNLPDDAEIIRWSRQRIKVLKLKRLLAGSHSKVFWEPPHPDEYIGYYTSKDSFYDPLTPVAH